MLDVMRRNSQSFLIYLIFGALVVVFAINFGPGSSGCSGGGGGSYAAMVNGDVITQQQFALDYGRQLDMFKRNAMRSNPNMQFDAEMAEKLGLRRQVIDDLIDRSLLAQEAERWGIQVTDKELLERLESQYGVKDVTFTQYENWVQRSFDTTVPRFERRVRDDIAAQKLMDVIGETLSVSDDELLADYKREHDRVMLTAVRFPLEAEHVEAPSPSAIEALLSSDQAAVQARYERDKIKYRTEKKIAVRQIVRSLAKDATDAQVAKERGVLLALKDQIDGGADFAALATQNSQDPATAAQGGALGLRGLAELPPAIRDAVLPLKAGDMVREPVRTPSGLALLQVTEVQAPTPRPFDEVKTQVAADLLVERVRREKAQAEAQALLQELEKGASLDSLTRGESEDAKASGAKPLRIETPWVLRAQEGIPRIGSSEALKQAAFELTPEKPLAEQVFEVGGAFVVVQLKDREYPDVAKFEEQKETQRQQAIWSKRSRVVRDWLGELRRKAKIELSPALFGENRDA